MKTDRARMTAETNRTAGRVYPRGIVLIFEKWVVEHNFGTNYVRQLRLQYINIQWI